MDENEKAPAGFLETARRLGGTLLAVFQNRLELAIVELQQERIRIFEALLLVAVVVSLGFFTLAVLSAAVMLLIWDNFGVFGLLVALFVLGGLGLIGTALFVWRLWARLKDWSFLPGTLAELKKDCECLSNK